MLTDDGLSAVDEIRVDVDGKFRFPRVVVGGLPIAVLNRRRTANLTIATALSRRYSGRPCAFFTTANGQVVSLCASQREVKLLFERADLISADGMSVVYASRLGSGPHLPERVATTDAFHDAARVAQRLGASFYFLGGSEAVSALAVERVRAIYPGLKIAGRRSGYFDRSDEVDIINRINAVAPDVLWIGMGVPAQQRFVVRNVGRLTSVGVAKTCGGLLDFLAGRSRRAPRWMQRAALEWAYRVMQEPRRLSWRYLTTNPHAAYWMLRSRAVASEGIIEADAAE
jgi:exopolysaccharide biosynthesis WecB/TagA/CpsF family protein